MVRKASMVLMDPHHQNNTATVSKAYLQGTISPGRRRRWSTVVGLRRKKLPVVRLGGQKPRRGLFILRMLRRIRVKWCNLQYRRKLRKLKEWYRKFVRDLIEGSATPEGHRQRLFMEATSGVPGLGVSFSGFLSFI